jgi:predicted transcriptional regulator
MKSLDTKKLSTEIKKKVEKSSFGIAAKEVGIPKSILYRASNGTKPSVDNLLKIIDWLEIPLKDFEINV